MSIRLSGSTSGYTELDAGAVAGNNTLKMPTSNGAANQLLRNGATPGTLEFGGAIVSGTAQASTSGTAIDFTGIPAWVKRITVGFQTVSTNGSSIVQVQLGTSSGITASGYIGAVDSSSTGVLAQNVNTGLALTRSAGAVASATINGTAVFMLIGSNVWAGNSITANGNAANMNYSACSIALSGTLDRIRITTVNGTDQFDAGTVNILME